MTTDAVLAFSHPFAIWRFPSRLVRWLYKFMSQVACKGLIKEGPQINFNLLIGNSRLHFNLNFVCIPAGKLTELQAEESSESEEEC